MVGLTTTRVLWGDGRSPCWGMSDVRHYRLYFLDRKDHIRHALSLECESDVAALQLVEEHKNSGRLELWQGARQVARFDADEGAA